MPQSELPSGTVTLLFTDIEGSTRRWEALPEAMAAALAAHDDLLRFAIEANGGHVFKTVGDAFCAAFADPGDALRACLIAQRSLAATDWGALGHVRVRMALHTGTPEHRDADYFGPPVNRVARLLSTGFGGQVLVSAATAELVRDRLPTGAGLTDLGAHRLKDLLQPERIYQVAAPGLEETFPPLKSLDRQPHNLPAQPTPLVGRDQEVAAARSLLEDGTRLVTLTGPGGTGKTRLGLQIAADLVDGLHDGAWFVGLAPLTDAGLVVGAIAAALGVRETGHEPLEATLLEYLAAKELVLLLDNFEHVVAAAPVVGRILAACPKVQLLVTSRAVLRVYGEREVAVPPLALPNLKRLPPLAELAEVAAVELFVERAQAVKPGFALTAEIARTVAELVVKLEGLPLAIELAAARVRILTPAQLLSRLSSRLGLLTGGAADRDERQRTLRGAIAWSHDLLPPAQQVLFRRLAVFAGGTYAAIEAVGGADGTVDVLDGLEGLVSQNLLRQEEYPDGPRFFMLETIREFAAEQLAASGEAAAIRARHAEHYLEFAEEAAPQLTGAGQEGWLHRLAAEHDNLRSALGALAQSQQHAEELRLAGALWRFWDVRGHLTEGRQWLDAATAHAGDADPQVLGRALTGAAWLAWGQGDYDQADALHARVEAICSAAGNRAGAARARFGRAEVARAKADFGRAEALHAEALSAAQEAGDRRGVFQSLYALGTLAATVDGDLDAAAERYAQAVAIVRGLGDMQGLSVGLTNLGAVEFLRGQFTSAALRYEEVLTISRGLGDAQTAAAALANQAEARLYLGGWESALRLGGDALTAFQDLGDRHNAARALLVVGSAALEAGDPRRSGEAFAEALVIARDLGDTSIMAPCLEGVARVELNRERPDVATLLFGAAAATREAVAAPVADVDRAAYDAALADLRAALGPESFQFAWELGRTMSSDQAVSEALSVAPLTDG